MFLIKLYCGGECKIDWSWREIQGPGRLLFFKWGEFRTQFVSFNFAKFIYFILRETARVGEGQKGRKRIPSRLRSVGTEPDMELRLTKL